MKGFIKTFISAALLLVITCFVALPMQADAESTYNFNYKIVGEEVYITSSRPNTATHIVIPATIEGLPVTRIADHAFYNCGSIQSVVIEERDTNITIGKEAFSACTNIKTLSLGLGVMVIGEGAFSYTSLEEVVIPDSVTDVAQCAFEGCKSLKKATIGDGVVTLGDDVFRRCEKLQTVYIGKGLASIGDYVFGWCKNLKTITVDPENKQFCNDKYGALYSKDMSKLYRVPPTLSGTYVVPEGVTHIGGFAFENAEKLTGISLPDSVISIGDGAFSFCKRISSLSISDGITYIGYAVFEECDALAFKYYDGAAYLGNKKNPYALLVKAGSYTDSIKDGTRVVGPSSFAYANGLTSITIPSSVAQIADGAFERCKKLKSIVIPGTVTVVGERVFEECTALKSVTICNGVECIEGDAFVGCTGLTQITIPGSIRRIEGAFRNCINLSDVTIEEGVSCIGAGLFQGCTSLEEIYIPNSVTSIGGGAFMDCTGLKSIEIPANVTSIEWGAFSGCLGLTELTIPDTVTYIGPMILDECSNLQSLTIPFVGESIKTPQDDWRYTLGYLFGLYSFEGSLPATQYYYGEYSTMWIYYIPASLKKVTVTGGDILEGAFQNCTGLEEVILPDSATSIRAYAFQGCTNLKNIRIPEGVTTLEKFAFQGCTSLEGMVLLGDVIYIYEYAFKDCTSLEYLVLPDSMNGIEYGAFMNCPNLQAIFYQGTRKEPSMFHIGMENDNLRSAQWHYNTKEAVFSGKACYYCSECDNYFLPNGTCATALVVFENWDGTVLSSKQYKYKDAVQIPTSPTRQADNTYTYAFAGWDKEIVNCVGDATYRAVFEKSYITYYITFQYENGDVIQSGTYHYGDKVEAPVDPAKPNGVEEGFVFRGWDKIVVNCNGDAVYIAVFGPPYVIGDLNNDGLVTDADVVRLLYYTFLPDAYSMNQSCDFNKDGEVTDADAVYLLYFTFLPDSYPIT